MSISATLPASIRRFVKFGIVGGSGTLIDFSLTWLCRDIFGFPDLIAIAIGFVVAATTNYILNRIWTWHSTEKNVGIEYLKFFAVSVIGFLLTDLFFLLFRFLLEGFDLFDNRDLNFWISKVFDNRNDLNFWISKVGATLIVMLWNFFANNFFTFKKKS